jgi:hypothetical protein
MMVSWGRVDAMLLDYAYNMPLDCRTLYGSGSLRCEFRGDVTASDHLDSGADSCSVSV